MNYNVYTFFLSLNPSSLKEIQGENLHNFKEILLMMYVYHKAAFTFEVSFSTSTYDARWMCFNFTHILMNIVGSIYLHNSLQTFSIRIVWQWKTVKGILVLYTIKGKKKCSTFAKETLKWRTMQYKTKTQYQEYAVYQGPLNTYFLQY